MLKVVIINVTSSILKISTEFFITTFCQSKANLQFSFSQLFSSLKHCICFSLENVYGTVADKGKPWFMYEAFQHIMKAQVEFLIGLGVNPALKVPCEFLLIINNYCSLSCISGAQKWQENCLLSIENFRGSEENTGTIT